MRTSRFVHNLDALLLFCEFVDGARVQDPVKLSLDVEPTYRVSKKMTP
jgi:hypothetical protein